VNETMEQGLNSHAEIHTDSRTSCHAIDSKLEFKARWGSNI